MSALNLVPDLELLGVQTGIFLANLVVVKTLIINPYLSLQKKRQAQTSGSQAAAQKTLETCNLRTAELESQLQAAYAYGAQVAEQRKTKALAEQQQLIATAKQHAEQELVKMRHDIAEQAERESSKIPTIAAELSKEFYRALMQRS